MSDFLARLRQNELERIQTLENEINRCLGRLVAYRTHIQNTDPYWSGDPSRDRSALRRSTLDLSKQLSSWRAGTQYPIPGSPADVTQTKDTAETGGSDA
jgi:hypothetical protein